MSTSIVICSNLTFPGGRVRFFWHLSLHVIVLIINSNSSMSTTTILYSDLYSFFSHFEFFAIILQAKIYLIYKVVSY